MGRVAKPESLVKRTEAQRRRGRFLMKKCVTCNIICVSITFKKMKSWNRCRIFLNIMMVISLLRSSKSFTPLDWFRLYARSVMPPALKPQKHLSNQFRDKYRSNDFFCQPPSLTVNFAHTFPLFSFSRFEGPTNSTVTVPDSNCVTRKSTKQGLIIGTKQAWK